MNGRAPAHPNTSIRESHSYSNVILIVVIFVSYHCHYSSFWKQFYCTEVIDRQFVYIYYSFDSPREKEERRSGRGREDGEKGRGREGGE